MSPLRLLPNVEALVSAFLRAHPDVVVVVGDRVYTVVPSNPTWPLVRVHQWDDQPAGQTPLHHVAAYLQLDAFGGSKAQAWRAAETCRMAMSRQLTGVYVEAVVTGCDVRGLADDPDDSYTPAKPRFRFDAVVYCHPPRSLPVP
ncbi:MAG: DUF3168 domain-containing protein [Chloroflexi bacterium]|nr:DUF3168 domain-containing protein [Chloroflexota bacterium]